MSSRVSRFLKDSLILMFGSFGSKFMAIVMIPLYTSILSAAEYGEIDIIYTTVNLLMPIVTCGMVDSIFRFIMSKEAEDGAVLVIGFRTGLCMYVVITIITGLLNYFFLHWEYAKWMLFLLGGNVLYEIFSNYLKAKRLTKKYVICGMLQTFISLSLNIVFLLYLNLGIEGYVLAFFISYSIPSFIIFIMEKIYLVINIRGTEKVLAREMFAYGIPLIFSTLSWWIVNSSDRYMIRVMMGASAVGIYSVASKIPSILQTVISVLQTVWQISTNEIYEEEPEELKNNFELFTKNFRQIGFISGSFLIMTTPFIMYILARNEFYEGWKYAPFLILSVVFSFATGMVSSIYGAYKKNNGLLYSVLVGGILNIILNIVLIGEFEIMGATISTAISRLVIAVYRLKDTERLLQFDRGYNSIVINCFAITLQCICLIYVENYRYLLQVILFTCILVYNRNVIQKLIRELKKWYCKNKV